MGAIFFSSNFSRGGPKIRGGTNERPETDHVTSGPMRGLEKTAPHGTEPETDWATL